MVHQLEIKECDSKNWKFKFWKKMICWYDWAFHRHAMKIPNRDQTTTLLENWWCQFSKTNITNDECKFWSIIYYIMTTTTTTKKGGVSAMNIKSNHEKSEILRNYICKCFSRYGWSDQYFWPLSVYVEKTNLNWLKFWPQYFLSFQSCTCSKFSIIILDICNVNIVLVNYDK